MKIRLLTLLLLVFAVSCDNDNPEYELGFEEGCAAGKNDAYSCESKNPRVGDLEAKESQYAEGFYEGYGDCYEAATLLSTCNTWSDWDSGY